MIRWSGDQVIRLSDDQVIRWSGDHLEVDGRAEALHGVEEVVGEVGGGEGEGEHLAGVAVPQEIHHLRAG